MRPFSCVVVISYIMCRQCMKVLGFFCRSVYIPYDNAHLTQILTPVTDFYNNFKSCSHFQSDQAHSGDQAQSLLGRKQ